MNGSSGAVVSNSVSRNHGTHGIVAVNASNTRIVGCEVSDVGCSGIRASGGNASTLRAGNVTVEGNVVTRHANWKRSYQPGIFWSGVSNRFLSNTVSGAPHNCMLGGVSFEGAERYAEGKTSSHSRRHRCSNCMEQGDFGDGVDNVFEDNTLTDCTYETLDSGAFYTCGQQGAAFVNRGNVLRSNCFRRIYNTAGTGVQRWDANSAVYLDDQMSGWT